MIGTEISSDFLRRPKLVMAGFWVMAAGSVASLFIAMMNLPFFRFGIWYQSEPSLAALHVLSGVTALGMGVFLFARPSGVAVLWHPFVLLPLALAVWTGLVALLQPLPAMAWFGSIEVGEGGLWYLELAVLTAAFMVLSRVKKMRPVLLLAAIILVLPLALVTQAWNMGYQTELVPYYFPDYVAFFGIFLAAAAAGLANWRLGWLFAVAAGLVVVWISDNWTAIGLVFVGAPMAWALLRFLPMETGKIRALGVAGTVATALLITGALTPRVLEDTALQDSLAGRLANSVLSRHHLAHVAIDAVADKPAILAVGSGWGGYSDHLAARLPVEWVILREDVWKDATMEFSASQIWDAVLRVDFHSHNFVIEALLGGGLLAVALSIGVFAILPLYCRRRHLPLAGAVAVAGAGLSAFWFQFAVSLPLMAMAWGALARPVRIRPKIPKKAGVALLFLVGGMLCYTGVVTMQFARSTYFFTPEMSGTLLDEDGVRRQCPQILDDQGRGGLHMAHRLRTFTSFLTGHLRPGKGETLNEQDIDRLRGMICAAEDSIDRGAMLRLSISSLLARADLAFVSSTPEFDFLRAEYFANWGERLDQVLKVAPKRTDLAATYLLWLLNDGRADEFTTLANRIYAANPADPVGLWFSGIAILEDPRRAEQGLERMKKAVVGGIERFIPVEDEIKLELGFPVPPSDSGS